MGERKVIRFPNGSELHFGGVETDPLTGEWQYLLFDDPADEEPRLVRVPTGDLCRVPGCLGGRRCPAHGEGR